MAIFVANLVSVKVFISWSGEYAQQIAELLREWLESIHQLVEPWMSSHDLDGGTQWFSEINDQLAIQGVGLAILTPDNKDSTWIHYECGALAKGLSNNRVFGLCFGLKTTDIKPPLGQFNLSIPDKKGMRKLIFDINSMMEKPLKESILELSLNNGWPQFDTAVREITERYVTATPMQSSRTTEDMLSEVLDSIRDLNKGLFQAINNQTSDNTQSEINNSFLDNSTPWSNGFLYPKDYNANFQFTLIAIKKNLSNPKITRVTVLIREIRQLLNDNDQIVVRLMNNATYVIKIIYLLPRSAQTELAILLDTNGWLIDSASEFHSISLN